MDVKVGDKVIYMRGLYTIEILTVKKVTPSGIVLI